ncbi:Protein of unknown function [Pyronema omphalodes CBS 100304]|uniref:Uncharacterized protein n=1 Tax=Pyronema omphalodes (strain CBS 100304) TaxID=1076935 RepID=U4LSJ0_PYROM|nr:Protein of unknown function [Pyronema omphalodes CBS 100304]
MLMDHSGALQVLAQPCGVRQRNSSLKPGRTAPHP